MVATSEENVLLIIRDVVYEPTELEKNLRFGHISYHKQHRKSITTFNLGERCIMKK